VNALIKRASIKVQMTQNTQGAYEDFNEAIKLDPENGDIFHHRGQVCKPVASKLFDTINTKICAFRVTRTVFARFEK
jgi:hypothetical protein